MVMFSRKISDIRVMHDPKKIISKITKIYSLERVSSLKKSSFLIK